VQIASTDLYYRATHDALTSLANRALFYGSLRQQLVWAERCHGSVVRYGEARFSADCAVRFRAEEYPFSDVFRSLTKADVTEKWVDAFLKKLDVSLSGVKDVYVLANVPATCAPPVLTCCAIGDRLLIPSGGTFYS
jgi:hypothetical protein